MSNEKKEESKTAEQFVEHAVVLKTAEQFVDGAAGLMCRNRKQCAGLNCTSIIRERYADQLCSSCKRMAKFEFRRNLLTSNKIVKKLLKRARRLRKIADEFNDEAEQESIRALANVVSRAWESCTIDMRWTLQFNAKKHHDDLVEWAQQAIQRISARRYVGVEETRKLILAVHGLRGLRFRHI